MKFNSKCLNQNKRVGCIWGANSKESISELVDVSQAPTCQREFRFFQNENFQKLHPFPGSSCHEQKRSIKTIFSRLYHHFCSRLLEVKN